MRQYVVKNWMDLQERLYEDSYNDQILRFRSNYVFRGISSAKYSLVSSFSRVCKRPELEMPLLRTFRKYASANLPQTANFWDTLSIAQHHGLPTRLLDWSFSPYVALHFMSADMAKHDRDGAVWRINFIKANHYLPPTLQEILETEKVLFFTTPILNKYVHNFQQLRDLEEEAGSKPYMVFIEPPSIDSRIVNQYSLFSMMSQADCDINSWLEEKDIYEQIIIPKELKLEIRDKLDQVNITERVLFPGLDGLCAWLGRHYTPIDGSRSVDTKIE